MTGLLTRTACGLHVVPDGQHRLWSNFTRTTKVADMPGDQENLDALSLIGSEVMAQVGQNTATGQFVTPSDVAFACLHAGEIERVEHPGLDFADPDVPDEVVAMDAGRQQFAWTVCGVIEHTWRTVCWRGVAGTPLVAYFRAWDWVQEQHGGHLLLAAVHEGHRDALETFGFADPWIDNEAAMQAKANTEWGVQ